MRLMLVLLLAVFLSGCFYKERIVYRDLETTFEDHWFEPCRIVPPPDQVEYGALSDRARAVAMAGTYARQIKETSECNIRFQELRSHNNRLLERNRTVRME